MVRALKPFPLRHVGPEKKVKILKKSVWLVIRCQLSCSNWRTTESRKLLSLVSKVTSARQESQRSLAIVSRLLILLRLLPSSTSVPHAPSLGFWRGAMKTWDVPVKLRSSHEFSRCHQASWARTLLFPIEFRSWILEWFPLLLISHPGGSRPKSCSSGTRLRYGMDSKTDGGMEG